MEKAGKKYILRDFGRLSTTESKTALHKHTDAPTGSNIFERCYPALDYIAKAKQDALWFEGRGQDSAPRTHLEAHDEQQDRFYGLNFATNNYLGLSYDEQTIEAAVEGAKTFGVNSAGSPLAFGATKYYMQLKEEIGEFLSSKTLIYSVGWMCGFGALKGLVREWDHVVMDEFMDNGVVVGAEAATSSVTRFRHLDAGHMEQVLSEIRSKDKENAIVVVTEALYGWDSCSPNLVAYQAIAKKHNAFLFIHCAHDLGVLGDGGKGVWEEQGLQDRSNVMLVATASKTLSINFGFVACTDANVPEYMKYFSTAYMFTNAINPVQANAALACLRTVRSHKGKLLRDKVLANCGYLRDKLTALGYEVLGRVSGFVCVKVGNEIVSRMIVRILMDNGKTSHMQRYTSITWSSPMLPRAMQWCGSV